MDSRWYRLRDVVGGPVILDTAILTESSSLFWWAYFDDRQNCLRDVVGGSVNLIGPWTQSFGLQHSALSPPPPFDGHRAGSACCQLIKSRFS